AQGSVAARARPVSRTYSAERRVVAHGGEVVVARGPLARGGVALERDREVLDGRVAVAPERLVAGELVAQRRVLGPVREPLRRDLHGARVIAGAVVRLGLVPVLEGRSRARGAGDAADHEHG